MKRLLGACMLAGCAAWTGFRAARDLRRRERTLGELDQGLELLSRELGLSAAPMDELLGKLAQKTTGAARSLFHGAWKALEKLDVQSFSQGWGIVVQNLPDLEEDAKDALVRLGQVLGSYGGEEQRQAIDAARRELGLLRERARSEWRRMGRVYQALGLSGGAFFLILLL